MTAFVFSLGRSFERSIALDRYGNFGVSDGFPGDDRFDFDKVRSHHNGTHRPHRGKPRHRRRPHHGDHPPHHDDHPRPPHHGDHPHPPHHGDHDYPHDPPHGDHRGPPPKDNEEVPLRDEEASASETSGDTE
ncbi:hypothetical protein BABINDRAFT_161397 [Babjeviella inositovora NRRL Y-12698]|uniref:Uncharacterized protein n=1 Tax=Babjeviella inositovora NRRL Y-12698 TaxID=984486 RepID=A0A1E3QPP5_9ASCO|nr:uncharacterized protein BABINDRAFT_161397 [Babjeviella inositovora NRRL Y-12698]ODQ79679.1 hypothetical protein BABINDRAFT_161397 [Babjeviella inositovora NRRL Y-12698]